VVACYRGTVKRLFFRGDAAFANPEMYEFLEAEGLGYVIRLPANRVLQDKIGYLLRRPVGRPPHEVRCYYASFFLGISPSRYMLLRRLKAVRIALRDANPATASVAEIAGGWGFTELGRFAGAYRTTFGESPSMTLRRAPGSEIFGTIADSA
jgi:Helix-turn-helix domain/Transposase DDE domain group 1